MPRGRPRKPRIDAAAVESMAPFGFPAGKRPRGRPRKPKIDVAAVEAMAPFGFPAGKRPRGRPRKPRIDVAAVEAMAPVGFPAGKIRSEEQVEEESKPLKPIQWKWKRQSFQGKEAKVDTYVRLQFIGQIKTQLTDIDRPEMYDKFATSCFGRFLHLDMGKNHAAMHALLGREVSLSNSSSANEFWFRIGDQFVRFSKYEYALVTGLRFGDSSFNPNVQHAIPSDGVYARRIAGSRRIPIQTIYNHFVTGKFADSVSDQVKIAKVLFLYKILLGALTNEVSVDDWVWALIEDDEAWESFPWGKFSYQVLSHRMRGLPTSQPKEGKFRYCFHGFTPALLIWAYEAIPKLGRVCGDRVDDEDLQRPRLIRWRMSRNKKMDMTDFFNGALKCHERLEPSAEELEYFARDHVNDDLGAGVQYVNRESSTSARRRLVVLGGSRRIDWSQGRGCRVRLTNNNEKGVGCKRAPLHGDRDEVDPPPPPMKRTRVVVKDECTSDTPSYPLFVSSDFLQRVIVMFQSDVDRVLESITRLETCALDRLGGLERRIDALEKSLPVVGQPRSVVEEMTFEDKSAAGYSSRDKGPENNSPENIAATAEPKSPHEFVGGSSSVINNAEGVILPDQTAEEKCDTVKRNEQTISRPPNMRMPCYGWIESDDEDDFIILKQAHAEVGGTTKSRGKRRTRWDLKPDDP